MSSFLISELENLSKENLKIILDITDEKLLNDVSNFILSKKDKDAVKFLIENDKISKSLSFNLFQFIVHNVFWDMFLNLDYNKFDVHASNDYALRHSSQYGQIEVVKFLIEKGANIHAIDDHALIWSSQYGHIEVVKFLVEKGANIHADDECALRESSRNGHIDVVKFLVENGANIHANNNHALRTSCINGHNEVVKFLVEKGANIHIDNDYPLIWSNIYNRIEVVKILLNSDLEYFSKNQKAIEIVKSRKLVEFYEKFGIDVINQKIPQSKDDIMKYIDLQDLETLKKCEEFDFSIDEYYYFFKCLSKNNIELIQFIFDKIKDKDDLKVTYNKISPCFNEESKSNFNQLFKNIRLNEIKQELEKLKDEIKKLVS